MISAPSSYREYSITTQQDSDNIKHKRCPEYALNWDHSSNQAHWPDGHDYFLGNGKNITDNKELRQILSEKLARGTLHNKIIFCDLDGVLADFDQGVFDRLKKRPAQVKPALMWGVINKSKTFFETLPWMPKGRELWDEIKEYDPIILTGTPRSSNAEEQKRKWCARELGPNIHVITCATKDKPEFCIINSVLIDDRSDNLNSWNAKGGKFLLYDEDSQDKIVEKIHKHMESDPGLCLIS
jgi:5'(3')-deoxyribonucleotidase